MPPAHVGVYTLALSPGRSLWPYAALAFLAVLRLRSGDPPARFLGGLALVPFAIELFTGAWTTDAGWGPAGLAVALVPLLVLASPALVRPGLLARGLVLFSLAVGLASVVVAPDAYVRVQAAVPGLQPPGHPRFASGLSLKRSGLDLVPDLSPVPGQLWMAWLCATRRSPARSRPPWSGQFWRGFEPREGAPPDPDLAVLGAR